MGCKLLQFGKVQFVAVFFDELNNVAAVYIDSSGIIAWVNTHRLVFKVLVEVDNDALILVVQNTEWCNCAGIESKLGVEVSFRGKTQRSCLVLVPEFLEINLLILKAGDEVIFLFLVIADEQILGNLLRVRQVTFHHFLYSVNSRVLNYLIADFLAVEQINNILFSKCHSDLLDSILVVFRYDNYR